MNKLLDIIHVPKDVTMGLPLLRMTGTGELCIENYRGILEYTDTIIRIQTKSGQIQVTGKCLQITNYNSDEMKIIGSISMLTFGRGV